MLHVFPNGPDQFESHGGMLLHQTPHRVRVENVEPRSSRCAAVARPAVEGVIRSVFFSLVSPSTRRTERSSTPAIFRRLATFFTILTTRSTSAISPDASLRSQINGD